MKRPGLILLLLVAGGGSLATVLDQRAPNWVARGQTNNILKVLFGDGRRLFANHFFVQADVSFHSGYYPSVFDQARTPRNTHHLTSKEGEHEEDEHEKEMNFLGRPRDWIERFGRNFMITEHTHVEGSNEREILPWLKLSSELDPQKIETYTVAAYWLRDMGKVTEAEDFLREGLRNNPDSYEILFELGRLCYENKHDPARARNLWEMGLRRWSEQQAAGKNPDVFVLEELALNLSRLEEKEGNLERAIDLLRIAQKGSPNPKALQAQIEELKQKLSIRPAAKPRQS